MLINQHNRNEEKGHGLAKYTLMLALAAIVVIVSLALMAPAIGKSLCSSSQSANDACVETAPEAPQLRTLEEVSQDCLKRGGSYEISYTDTYGVYTLRCLTGPKLVFQEDFS